jgi:putative heme iron utilization protein
MTEDKPRDVLQPVDGKARRLAKELIRTARFAALGTLDAATGAPSVSRVAIATFANGDPGFFISALAAHYPNLVKDSRCSLLVGEPGKGDPLAHARMTLIGKAEKLDSGADRDSFRARYRERNAKSKLYEDLPDFSYWRFRAGRISLNGGFGRAYALAPGDLEIAGDAGQAWDAVEPGVIQHMNEDHSAAVDKYAGLVGGDGVGWRLACIDPEGMDLVRNDDVRRLWFEPPLNGPEEIRERLVTLARK